MTKRSLLSTLLAFAALLLAPMAAIASEIPSSADAVSPLLIGASVADTTLQTPEGEDVSLKDLLAKQRTILVFYRGGWWPYCNTQLGQLQEIEQELLDLGWQIVAIAPDLPENLKPTVAKGSLAYKVLSDAKAEAIKSFGLAWETPAEMREQYKGYGIDLEKASGESHHILPVPAVYLVDTTGTVLFSYVNPDYKKRLEPQILLAAAKALK